MLHSTIRPTPSILSRLLVRLWVSIGTLAAAVLVMIFLIAITTGSTVTDVTRTTIEIYGNSVAFWENAPL